VTFDWRKVADLAEELASREDEAALRSAVSRAYYALYCTARDSAGLDTSGLRDAHKAVFDYYAGRKNPKLRHLGVNQLPGLFRQRKTADYDETVEVRKGAAVLAVQNSKRLLADLAKLTPEEIRK
jgi:uncharacterized protein (UPF0332 family)